MCKWLDSTIDMLSRRTCPKSSLCPPGSSWEGVSWRFWFWLWVFVLYGGFCNNWIIDIVLVSNEQFSLCCEMILRTVHFANSDLCVRCIYKSVAVPYGACYNMWYLLSVCWNKSQTLINSICKHIRTYHFPPSTYHFPANCFGTSAFMSSPIMSKSACARAQHIMNLLLVLAQLHLFHFPLWARVHDNTRPDGQGDI